MENKELLFNLVKKLESGEFVFETDDTGVYFLRDTTIMNDKTTVQDTLDGKDKFGYIALGENKYDAGSELEKYDPKLNNDFKEDFYKDKGLDKCWYKDCPNKIYQSKEDYKAVNIPCQDKHKRYICLKCYEERQ